MDILGSNLRSLSITGNVYLDGVLLAHLVPLVVTYARELTTLFRSLFLWLLGLAMEWLHARVNSRVVGTLVCNTNVYHSDSLFGSLNKAVFLSEKFLSNSSTSGLHSKYGEIVDKEADGTAASEVKGQWTWLYRQQEFSDSLTLTMNSADPLCIQSGRRAQNVIRSAMHETSDPAVKLLFTFTYVNVASASALTALDGHGKDDGNGKKKPTKYGQDFIKMRVRAFGDQALVDDKKFIHAEIKAYLCQHLGILESLKYAYEVTCNSASLSSKMMDFLNSRFMSRPTGILNYGDTIELGCKDNQECASTNVFEAVLNEKALRNDMDNSSNVSLVPVQGSLSTGRLGYTHWLHHFGSLEIGVGTFGVAKLDGVLVVINAVENYGKVNFGFLSDQGMLTNDNIKALVTRIINDAYASSDVKETKEVKRTPRSLYHYCKKNWEKMTMDPRTTDTLYLHPDVHAKLMGSLDTFLKLKDLYERIHLTYKTGILLYGPPGTGKTSTIRTLAHMYQMDVYMLDVNDPSINDSNIAHILNQLASNQKPKMLVLEDVDSAFAEKEKMCSEERRVSEDTYNVATQKMDKTEKQSFLTYSGFLQAMDGLNSHQTGVIFFMTTNHIEKLGDALIREGRVDHRVYMGPCCHLQIVKMVETIVGRFLDMSKLPKDDLHDKAVAMATQLCHGGKLDGCDGQPIVPNDLDPSPVKPCSLQTYILSNILDQDALFSRAATSLLASAQCA